MRWRQAQAKNFYSFREVSFDLANRGLVGIEGVNEDSVSSDSNGAGKSALFEILCWTLFKASLRGKKPNRVQNHFYPDEPCTAMVEFEKGGHTYRVQRSLGGKKVAKGVQLWCDDVDISKLDADATDAEIERIIGYDFWIFTYFTILGKQEIQRFSLSKDTARKELFDRVLRLDVYEKAEDAVSKEARAVEHMRSIKLQEIDTLNKQLQKMAMTTSEYKAAAAKEGDEKQKQIDALQAKMPDMKTLQLDIEVLQQKIDEASLQEHAARGSAQLIRDKQREIERKYEKELAGLQAELSQYERSFGNIQVGQCPTCKQQVTEEHKKSHEEVVNAHMMAVKHNISGVYIKFNGEKIPAEEIQAADKVVTDAYTRATQRRDLQQEKIRELKRGTLLQQDIDRVQSASSGYEAKLEECKKLYKEWTDQLNKHHADCAKLEEDQRYFTYLQKAFSNKGMKSLLIESVVPFLNERAKIYADILTNGQVEVSFSATRGDTENFSVNVVNAAGDKEYEGNSDGEKRRIDLAIAFTVHDMIFQFFEPANCLILDEVVESLDGQGVECFMNLVKKKMALTGLESVLVITHNKDMLSNFENTWTVRKRGNSSELITV